MLLKVTLPLGPDGEDMEFPAHYEICPNCQGHGTHDHPAFSNGVNMSEWDEDDREHYYSGGLDVSCDECDGDGKVAVVNEDALTDAQKQDLDEHYRALGEIEATYAAERRMGA